HASSRTFDLPVPCFPFPIPTVRVAPLRSRADSRRVRRTSSTVPPAPSTELLRLMAPRVAVAQAKVSRVAGRGSHRSVHFFVRNLFPNNDDERPHLDRARGPRDGWGHRLDRKALEAPETSISE